MERKDVGTLPSFSHFFQTLTETKGVFLKAMLLTLELTAVSILIGIAIGLFFALLKISKIKILELISDTYVYLVRGTPLIVQIFILYFGISGIFLLPDFWAASLALALHNGAYISEILRGAIQAVDKGQMEAGTLFRNDKSTDIKEDYSSAGIPPGAAAFRQPIYHQFKRFFVSCIYLHE